MKIEVGDRIKFSSPTRCGPPTAVRVVNGFYSGCPTVGFHGWANFVVHQDEISEHFPKEETK